MGHVACMGEKRAVYRGNLRQKYQFEDTGVDGRIIIKCSFKS
jgi:hypothetical protein